MSAGRICSRTVITAVPDESVREAAQRMAHHGVGTLVVVKAGGSGSEPIGIVTDRDIAMRCVAEGRDPDTLAVSSIMAQPLRVIDQDMPIEHAIVRMAEAGARRLVVIGKGNTLVGLLSLDDILELLSDEFSPIHRLLEHQEPILTS